MLENEVIYKVSGIIIASLLMVALGKVNEKKKLYTGSKLIFQILISLIIVYSGIRIEFLRSPLFSGSYIYLNYLSIPLTIVWVVSITNSIGQTDDLGDITPYIVFIASLTFLAVIFLQKQGLILAEILSFFMMITDFVFIKYVPRGKLSSFYMFFGFILSIIAIVGVSKSTAALTLFIPLLILGVPLMDSTYSIVSSYVSQQGNMDNFSNTESRLRQKLQSYGFSAQGANYTIIATSFYLSFCAIIISIYQSVYLLIGMAFSGWLLFEMLKQKVSSGELIIQKDQVRDRINLFRVGIDRVNIKIVVSRIEKFIISKKPHLVVTPDTLAILRAQRDSEYHHIIRSANLVTPDGAGILWATATLHCPLLERVAGIDIIQSICQLAAQKSYSIYLLGASPGVANEASSKLSKKYPGLKIVGNHHGYFHAKSLDNTVCKNKINSYSTTKTTIVHSDIHQDDQEEKILQDIENKKPDILLVGMGVPRQEKWIARNLKSKRLKVPVCMGVGGSFDVLSGKIPRAPMWMQKHGMEWIYRFIKQPQRAFNTLALFYFMGMVIRGKILLALRDSD